MVRTLHLDEQRGWRGGEQQASYLIKGLAQRGHFVAVGGHPDGEFTQRDHGIQNLTRITCPFRGEIDLLTAWRLAKAVKSLDIDILHAHTSHAHTLACLARMFARRAKVMVTRRVDFAPRANVINRWKYEFPDRIVCVSQCIADILREFGVSGAKLSVVNSAQDPARFDVTPCTRAELGLPEEAPLFGNVGAFVGHKDHATLIEAMSVVKKTLPGAHLALVGDGELRGAIEAQVAAAGLSPSVTFLGYRTDVPRILPVLDAFVLSSKQEGFGGVCAEAMFSGVPVVSTDAGGMIETVKPGITGLMVPSKTPQPLPRP
ncbi:MAG TPA: glycosyltransferase [Candidatus Hydrogenedentes bacterium]|nr:glycosyltransferase [Candidatus Hydrogenedentota bacterium]